MNQTSVDYEGNYYITDEHYKIAKRNGINDFTLRSRIHNYGWEINRAITEKPQKRNSTGWSEWKETALANGIGRDTYFSRISRGKSPEEASTLPKMNSKDMMEKLVSAVRLYPAEFYDISVSNGISKKLFYQRVSILGWSLEDACTIPPRSVKGNRHNSRRKVKGQ